MHKNRFKEHQSYLILSYHSIKLLTLNWCVVVIKLLRDYASETQNPYTILKPYYRGWLCGLAFLFMPSSLSNGPKRKRHNYTTLPKVVVSSKRPICCTNLDKWYLKRQNGSLRFNVTGFQLDPMPRGIGIEEKQKELFAAI